jgi:RNA polymerase sigma-70 factor (ECF subfamily)
VLELSTFCPKWRTGQASSPIRWSRQKAVGVALSEIDRHLIQRCLAQKPRAWDDFVDRFLGLVIHVINHTAQSRSVRLSDQDREDMAAEVFLAIISNDYGVLRRFRGESSLATYLTVVARRVVVREILKHRAVARRGVVEEAASGGTDQFEERISNREEVEHLLSRLEGDEAKVVRMYHLESKSYHEISAAVGMPENSIGPMLSRARAKMRRAADTPAP